MILLNLFDSAIGTSNRPRTSCKAPNKDLIEIDELGKAQIESDHKSDLGLESDDVHVRVRSRVDGAAGMPLQKGAHMPFPGSPLFDTCIARLLTRRGYRWADSTSVSMVIAMAP